MSHAPKFEIDQRTASMDDWVRWIHSGRPTGWTDSIPAYTPMDWVAIRCLAEEFPSDDLAKPEAARREEAIARYQDPVQPRGSIGHALKALRADRDRNPERYWGQDYQGLMGLPWRVEWRSSLTRGLAAFSSYQPGSFEALAAPGEDWFDPSRTFEENASACYEWRQKNGYYTEDGFVFWPHEEPPPGYAFFGGKGGRRELVAEGQEKTLLRPRTWRGKETSWTTAIP